MRFAPFSSLPLAIFLAVALAAGSARALIRNRVRRILPLIAVTGLLAGCQKSGTFRANGNVAPVNESAMPTPEVSATDTGTGAAETSNLAEAPGTPPPALTPSPATPMGVPSPVPREKPAPLINGLTDALNSAATKGLAAPTLANEQIAIPARPGQLDAQASEIIAAATAAGGVAIRSVNSAGQTSILATIPENNADAFKAALKHETIAMAPPSPSTTLIEVLVEPPAASPSP
jgi:hypothetical protein